MGKIKYGILHNHTEYSVRDSAMTVKRLLERAKELNAPAVALTDHGILTGILEFMKIGKEYGIKTIPGIEAYYTPDKTKIDSSTKRQHLILMAKDYQGYQAICEANKLSYDVIINNKPCMTLDILQQIFGPETEGHNHVIATSACIQGVIASVLTENNLSQIRIDMLTKKRDKYHPLDNEVLDALYEEEQMDKEIAILLLEKEALEKASKVNLTGLKRHLKTLKPTDAEYATVEKELAEETALKEKSKAELAELKATIKEKKSKRTNYIKSIKPLKEQAEKWSALNDQIEEIIAQQTSIDVLKEKAEDVTKQFVEIFGKENFYMELQYHHYSEEAKVMPLLVEIAQKLNVPMVVANDAHYPTNHPDDIRAQSLMSALQSGRNANDYVSDESYGELYIKTDEELMSILSEIIDKSVLTTAFQNIGKIVDACNVVFPTESHYPVFPNENEKETSAERLRRLAVEGIPKRYPGNKWTKELQDRMDYELNIIDTMGFSDYLCIVQDFLQYGRELGFKCPEKVGYSTGPGRGSAAGSIVAYLSGITSVDPIRYNLLFERFLNPERVSMPDIDCDFANEIRDQVIAYVGNKYKRKEISDGLPTCSIITKGTMAAKKAIRNAARVTGIPGSVASELCNLIPPDLNATIDSIPDLEQLCKENPVYKQLINDAKLIEGCLDNYGVHAAGVIISDNGDISKYVPLYRNIVKNKPTGPWVAQMDKEQCEKDAGLLKMDFLGLKNLDIISDALRRIYRNYNVILDVENLPEEPEVLKNIFAAGNTNSVFQFESEGMKNMLKKFKPNSMEDIVLLVAAYRPGPLQFVPAIIDVKHGKKKPHYIANGLEEILSTTYGFPIYQEQVMQIFNKIAGFSLGEADIIRRAMAKKKLSILTDPKTNYHGKFIDGLKEHGASEKDAEEFWEQLLDFASYA